MPAARAISPRARARAIASILGRAQAPELIFQQPFTALTSPIIPVRINLSRFLESIKLVWRGRVVIGTANMTTVGVEAPQSIIQQVLISGAHRLWNAITPINMTGATIFAWPRLFQAEGSALYIDSTSGAGTAPVKQGSLTTPMGLAGSVFGNTGTYDMEIHYDIPTSPWLDTGNRVKQVPYWWNPRDWADTLQIQLVFGDGTSWGVPGGSTTFAFTAYGSGAGSPTVSIFANYCILAGLADYVQSAVIIRNERTQTGGPVAAAGNASRLALLDKQKTTNVVIKSGTVTAAPSAGVQVYQTLSDQLLDKTIIRVDNKPVRPTFANFALKEYTAKSFNAGRVQGYLPISFIEGSQDPLTYYRGDRLPGGATFELISDIPTTTTRQTFGLIQEEVYGVPGATF